MQEEFEDTIPATAYSSIISLFEQVDVACSSRSVEVLHTRVVLVYPRSLEQQQNMDIRSILQGQAVFFVFLRGVLLPKRLRKSDGTTASASTAVVLHPASYKHPVSLSASWVNCGRSLEESNREKQREKCLRDCFVAG